MEVEEIRAALRSPRHEEGRNKTFDDLADHWLAHVTAHKRSPKDDRSMLRRHLRPAFGSRLLVSLDGKTIDEFRTLLLKERGLSANTVNN
jgi:hypothetical protein